MHAHDTPLAYFSMASSGLASRKIMRIPELLPMASATFWRTTSPSSGPWRTWHAPTSSTGEAQAMHGARTLSEFHASHASCWESGTTMLPQSLQICGPVSLIFSITGPPNQSPFPPLHRSHMAPMYTEFPFPKSLFEKFVKDNNGELNSLLTLLTHISYGSLSLLIAF